MKSPLSHFTPRNARKCSFFFKVLLGTEPVETRWGL
ncbi:hypothetical protein Gotri_018627 [Gossypium trilobum]|uniref:Uncharacterized protein n=1 Tax=Gossypium trilobum TaxID=34281 RepID=A0A7J9EAM0_9ROSI|nr:hypothetical protein [Gossypium trilobum]